MKSKSPFQLRSGNKPSAAKFFKGAKNKASGPRKPFHQTAAGKTGLGKLVSGITGSIFGSKTNVEYKGKGRSLFGSLADSRRKFKAKAQNKPTKSDGFGSAIGGQTGAVVSARGYASNKPMPKGAKYTDAVKLDKSKSFFS